MTGMDLNVRIPKTATMPVGQTFELREYAKVTVLDGVLTDHGDVIVTLFGRLPDGQQVAVDVISNAAGFATFIADLNTAVKDARP
jgi:hypothetical protein